MQNKKHIKVALAGQPNVGKSSLINALTKADMKVGNFAGVTVELARASTEFNGYKIDFIDLPGTYSLDGYSEEERIARAFIQEGDFDLIANIADSTNLERNLLLSAQLLEKDHKMLIALNMCDEAKSEGIKIDTSAMSELLGVLVLEISAKENSNLQEFLSAIIKTYETPRGANKRVFLDSIESELGKITNFLKIKNDPNINSLKLPPRAVALALLKGENEIYEKLHDKAIWLDLAPLLKEAHERLFTQFSTKDCAEIFNQDLIAFCSGICTECVKYESTQRPSHTAKIDRILINKFAGIPIFLFFMWAIFQLTFSFGEIPQGWIEDGFSWLGEKIDALIDGEQNPQLASLLIDGALGGVGAVLSFLPNIVILFFGISLLETTGYMARVAFLLDGFFHKFGLHGKSFIPLATGFGCSVPAFMAARTLKTKKDRLLTLFIVPFMQCGAKLPVFVLFCGAFAPENQAGNWLFGIYILGAIVGLICAKILRHTAFKGADEPFVMEMPKYRLPSWHLVWFAIWNKAKMYIKKAGTYILAASVLIWWAQTYPFQNELRQSYAEQIESAQTQEQKEELEIALQTQLLENSYLGKVGRAISPIFTPLGFEWRESVAILTGLAAKEVVLATMGVLYSVGLEEDEESESLRDKLREAMSLKTAIAFVLFAMFYNPCLAATMVFKREAGGWGAVGALFIFTFIVAYISALLGSLIVGAMG